MSRRRRSDCAASLTRMTRVRSSIAAASSSRSGWKSGQRSGTVTMHAAGKGDQRGVGVVVRLERRRPRRRRRRARGCVAASASVAPAVTSTSRCRVDVEPVEPLLVLGDRLAQIRDAAPGRVLVHPVGDRLPGRLEHLGRSVLVGEALTEVDRAGSRREGAHLGEDGGRDRAVGAEESCTGRGAVPGSVPAGE